MKTVVAAAFLQLILGGGFGEANVTVEAVDDLSMVVDIEVRLLADAQSVVAHLAFGDDSPIAHPLLDRGGGLFGITTELPAKNYAVVFEAIGSDEELSKPALMSDLGADFSGEEAPTPSTEPSYEEDGLSRETLRLGWLALGLATASLAVLAVWVVVGRDDEEGASEEE